MKRIKHLTILTCTLLAFCACSSGGSDEPSNPNPGSSGTNPPSKKAAIHISTNISSRATETDFETGDAIGLYVVNHQADGTASALLSSGNHVDNMKYTYSGTWTPATPTYWKDNTTHADFYLYYPYTSSITDVTAMPYSVKDDQSNSADYKAGDLLIGKTTDVTPTETAVKIEAKHVMSLMQITLAAGNGFTAESLAASKVSVKINGIKTHANVNLSTSAVTATGDATTITPWKDEDTYKAIIVPQTIAESKIITVNVDGKDFNLTKAFTFEAGKRYKCTVTISKASNGINVSISNWEDDGIDYGGTAE